MNQVWESVRSHNGIMVLMDLLSVKTPITDADSIRALACKALLGLARSENARQIMGKLPLFTSGQLQVMSIVLVFLQTFLNYFTFYRLRF